MLQAADPGLELVIAQELVELVVGHLVRVLDVDHADVGQCRGAVDLGHRDAGTDGNDLQVIAAVHLVDELHELAEIRGVTVGDHADVGRLDGGNRRSFLLAEQALEEAAHSLDRVGAVCQGRNRRGVVGTATGPDAMFGGVVAGVVDRGVRSVDVAVVKEADLQHTVVVELQGRGDEQVDGLVHPAAAEFVVHAAAAVDSQLGVHLRDVEDLGLFEVEFELLGQVENVAHVSLSVVEESDRGDDVLRVGRHGEEFLAVLQVHRLLCLSSLLKLLPDGLVSG